MHHEEAPQQKNAKVAVASQPFVRSNGRCLAGGMPLHLNWEHWASALALTKFRGSRLVMGW